MTISKDLAEKLRQDLEKSGFHAEMLAIQTFLRHGWDCRGSFGFFDREANQSREGDLLAIAGRAELCKHGGLIKCWIEIIGQVKHSAVPWIVFRQEPIRLADSMEAWDNLTHHINLPCPPRALTDTLNSTSLIHGLGWTGRSIHEAFRARGTPTGWYNAFVSAAKAAYELHRSRTRFWNRLRDEAPEAFAKCIELTIFKPLVILDGILVSATIDSTGALQFEEIERAAFRFEYKSTVYSRDHYCIDLVTLAGLDRYLVEFPEKRLQALTKAIVSHDVDLREHAPIE